MGWTLGLLWCANANVTQSPGVKDHRHLPHYDYRKMLQEPLAYSKRAAWDVLIYTHGTDGDSAQNFGQTKLS